MSDKFEFIDAERDNYPIIKMCVWLGVSRSGFYDWQDRPTSATAQRRGEITDLVRSVFEEFEQRYGYRKIPGCAGPSWCRRRRVAGSVDHGR